MIPARQTVLYVGRAAAAGRRPPPHEINRWIDYITMQRMIMMGQTQGKVQRKGGRGLFC